MNFLQYETYYENKSHTMPNFPYNTYLCSIPLDFPEVEMHWHSEAELIVIKKGRGIIEVDLKSYDVEEGNMLLILPGQLHSIKQKKNCIMEYENIIFETSFLGVNDGDLCGEILMPLFQGKLSHSVKIDENLSYYENVSKCIERIDKLCSEKAYGYQLGVKGNLFLFFCNIIQSHTEAAPDVQNGRSIEKIKLILSYISENYMHKITTSEAAAACYYSDSHFMRFFKAAMGESFIQYLNNYRLRIAVQLLLSTNESIIDIAAKTGFENLSYFNRCFKKRFGKTPGQYRNEAK